MNHTALSFLNSSLSSLVQKTPTSFSPPDHLLMGAGPATLHPRVQKALCRPLISHLDPLFKPLFLETQELLRYVFQTRAFMTLPIHGPGSLAMEACIANLVEPGDHIVIMNNGVYGGRMRAMAKRYGAKVTYLDHAYGDPLSCDILEETLASSKTSGFPVSLVCFVHGESATGVMSDAATLSKTAQRYGALTLCDMAATLGGQPLSIEECGLDAVYANPQKCLSAPPGLSPLTISDRAMHKIRHRKNPPSSWCIDLCMLYDLATAMPTARFYPYTSPVHCFYALHESLLMIMEEGLVSVWDRHITNAKVLTDGIKNLGFKYMTHDSIRIPFLNVVEAPEGININDFRTYLARTFKLEISQGMGEWQTITLRIGAMGQTSTRDNVLVCLNALGQTLQHFGKIVNIQEAMAPSERFMHHDASQSRCYSSIANGNTALS